MTILLGVNIDHVATLRQARCTTYPDVLAAGLLVEQAGADSITVHLREDRRHIQVDDVRQLKAGLRIPLNLEMALTADMLDFALSVRPQFCCLVPEKRQELTTEGGLDVIAHQADIRATVAALTQAGIKTSLFIDPTLAQIDAAVACGSPMIELHTGEYAEATSAEAQQQQLLRIQVAAQYAAQLGLQVNAGHGLHYHNTPAIAAITDIAELNIGHAIIARAVFVGLAQAVQDMRACMQ